MAIVVGISITILAGFLLFGPSGRDDVYMTLWPAQQFSERAEIVNYNGDAIEQSSSLLHVVVLGSVYRLVGGNIVGLNFSLMLIFGLLSIVLTLLLARKLELPLHWVAIAMGAQACFVYWSMGGLDAVLAAFCWLCLLLAYLRFEKREKWLWLLVSVVAVITVRPENGFVLLGVFGLLAVFRLFPKGAAGLDLKQAKLPLIAISMGIIVACVLGLARLYLTGTWFPQPVIAKASSPDFNRLLMGSKYLFRQTRQHPELAFLWLGIALSAFQLFRRKQLHIVTELSLAIATTGMLFVLVVGGDWMENARFVVPYLPILILLLFAALGDLPSKVKLGGSVVFVLFCVFGLIQTARTQGTGYGILTKPNLQDSDFDKFAFAERNNRDHLRDFHPLAVLQRETARIFHASGKKVTILSHQAGFMMFHLANSNPEQFRFIDLMGLCTTDFTDCEVTKQRGNLNGGLNMDLVFLFDNLPLLSEKCGFEAPDIVFDLDQQDFILSNHLHANNYKIVNIQKGIMPMGTGAFPGLEIDATEFVAVHPKWDDQAPATIFEVGKQE